MYSPKNPSFRGSCRSTSLIEYGTLNGYCHDGYFSSKIIFYLRSTMFSLAFDKNMQQQRHMRTLFITVFLALSGHCIQVSSLNLSLFPTKCAPTFRTNNSGWLQPRSRNLSMVTSAVITTLDQSSDEENGPAKQFDSDGNEFTVGSVVRVTKDLKAYHLSPKGCGAFDPETKEFVQSAKGGDRGSKSLSIPEGLRGTVIRVYDVNDFDASQPIVVKFVPGKYVDEGYDAPITFMMHFDNDELECV